MLNQADREIRTGKAAALLDANQESGAGNLRVELSKVDRLIRQSLQIAKEPDQRMADLVRVRKEAPHLVKAAEKSMVKLNARIENLEKTVIPKAGKDHPNRAGDILKRFDPLKKIQREADAALINARVQLERHEAGDTADYAILGTETDRVNSGLRTLQRRDKEFRDKVSELYRSYTKILEDMRIDYYVRVGRVSWDEDSDYWTEHNYIYPDSKVERDIYEHFRDMNPNAVPCRYSRARGMRYADGYATKSFYSKEKKRFVDVNYWKALKINGAQNWPDRRDDWAEFWIEDAFPKAYHKYLLVQNGQRQKTGWVEVDEEDYYDAYEHLGMEIASKPYGYFEEERVASASPPGMAYVGDKRYGEWRNDPATGRSFWYYYGIYSFLNRGPGFYHYRGDWDRWRGRYRNREPYYGGSAATGAAYGTFGSHVRTDGRYRNTEFARQGGLRAQAASVRGAGPARRGGGPGGKGK